MESKEVDKETSRQVGRLRIRSFTPPLVYLFTCLLVSLFTCLLASIPSPITLTDPETAQESSRDIIGSVSEGQTIGQSFVSRRSGLNSITLWLSLADADQPNGGALDIELYHTPQDQWPVYTTSLPFTRITGGAVTLDLPPRRDPAGQTYYLVLKTQSVAVRVLGRSDDAYPTGQAFLGQSPLAADIAFRLTYAYDWRAALADLCALLPRLWLAIPLAAALWLPGWLLLDISGLRRHFDGGEQTAIAVGLSLGLIPLAMLWTTTLGLTWNRTGVLVAWGSLAALGSWRFFRLWKRRRDNPAPSANPTQTITGLALVGVIVITLTTRLVMTRDLAAPAWVDSVHHAVITRLIVEQGSIPDTYAPFLNFPAYKYHPGFHVGLAAFHWLSGLEIADAMLLYGQVLNALAALAAYLLAVTLTRNRVAGVIAALVTGLLTPMPAYYASWGRYTQLAGLLIVPAILALIVKAWEISKSNGHQSPSHSPHPPSLPKKTGERRGKNPEIWAAWAASLPKLPKFPVFLPPPEGDGGWRSGGGARIEQLQFTALAGLASAGLLLVHYRMAAFAGGLVAAFAISQLAFSRRELWQLVRDALASGAIIAIVAGGLTIPWLIPTLREFILPVLSIPASGNETAFSDFAWRYLTTAMGSPAMLTASFGMGWGLLHRKRFVIALALWGGILFTLANLGALGLPGGTAINNTTVTISLFLPISVLAGYAVSEIFDIVLAYLRPPWRWISVGGLALAAVVTATLGTRAILPILNPYTVLMRQADRAGLAWLDQHLPADTVVAINPFNWGYGLYGGNDGGFWIEPLTGRQTVPPPVLYGLGPPDETQAINTFSQEIINRGSDPNRLWEYLVGQDVHYVFAGVRGGPISPQALRNSPHFSPLYAQDGVWIFQVLP